MRRAVCALAAIALLAGPAFGAAQPAGSVEQVVLLHLGWLESCGGYRAKITVTGGGKMATGTLEVDNITGKRVYMGWRPGIPKDVYLKMTRMGARGVEFAFSKGFGRKDDLPFAEKTLPEGLFFPGASDLFQRGTDLHTTMTRLRQISKSIAVLPPSKLGLFGLRLTMERLVTENLAALVDQVFSFDQSSPASAPDEITMWFNGNGRLDAVDLGGITVPGASGGREAIDLHVALEYEEITPAPANDASSAGPAPAAAAPVAAVARAAALPPAAEKKAEKLAEPFLGSRALVILSLVMLVICVGVVVRLALSQND
jgi:hypothetical protein